MDIDAKDKDNLTPLHIASEAGNISVVKELLKHNPNLDITDKVGQTALRFASGEGHTLVVKELLKFRGKFQKLNDWSLHIAAINGHIDVVRALLEHGVEVDPLDQDTENETPLHDAAEKGYAHIVKELLNHGANINARTNRGDTVIHKLLYCTTTPQYDSRLENEYLAALEVLLDKKYGIDLTLKCKLGFTPIETAIKLGEHKMARMIAKFLCPQPKITDSIYPLKHFL